MRKAGLAWLLVTPLLLAPPAYGAAVVRSAAGANPAAIQATVDQFRADVGSPNNPSGPATFQSGRREINWDGVPDALATPANLPGDFFNTTNMRGAVFTTPGTGFQVSQDNDTPADPDPDLVEFGNLNAGFATSFQVFSAQRLFAPIGSTTTVVRFFLPGTSTPATVNGFGAVFTDVDLAVSHINYYDVNGTEIFNTSPATADNGLSFEGVSFNAGERIARVEIQSGVGALARGAPDEVALDDFIYGEPQRTPAVQLGSASYSAAEDAGQVTLTFVRTGGEEPMQFDFATSDGSAAFGSYYSALFGTLSFNTGQTTKTIDVPILTDSLAEGDETFNVTLSNPSGGVLASPSSSTVTIVDRPPAAAAPPPPPPPPVAPPPPPPAAADTTAPRLTVSGLPSSIKRAKFLKGLSFSVTPSEAAKLEASLRATARSATISAYNLELATRNLPIASGKRTIKLRPSKRLVGRKRKFTVQVRVRGTDAAGNTATYTRKIKVTP